MAPSGEIDGATTAMGTELVPDDKDVRRLALLEDDDRTARTMDTSLDWADTECLGADRVVGGTAAVEEDVSIASILALRPPLRLRPTTRLPKLLTAAPIEVLRGIF